LITIVSAQMLPSVKTFQSSRGREGARLVCRIILGGTYLVLRML